MRPAALQDLHFAVLQLQAVMSWTSGQFEAARAERHQQVVAAPAANMRRGLGCQISEHYARLGVIEHQLEIWIATRDGYRWRFRIQRMRTHGCLGKSEWS